MSVILIDEAGLREARPSSATTTRTAPNLASGACFRLPSPLTSQP